MQKQIFKHDLALPYEPIITLGTVSDLVNKINQQKNLYPRTATWLLAFLQANFRIMYLEDWLVIGPYQLMWKEDERSLQWFENLFDQIAGVNPLAWNNWLTEVVQKCTTAHDIYDRIYTYLLHLYGVIVLAKQGHDSINIPLRKTDIESSYGGQPCATECKFVKTSRKFESYFNRFTRVCKLSGMNTPFIINLFNFPPSESITSLSVDDCNAVKNFTKLVAKNPDSCHIGYYNDQVFEYRPTLPAFPVTIEKQLEYAQQQALNFLNSSLSSTVNRAAAQLNSEKYNNYKKIIFIGIQWDFEYSIDWTRPAVEEIKLLLPLRTFYKYGIKVLFSEDYGFPVDRYI